MTRRRLFLYALLAGILIWALPFFAGQYIEVKYRQFVTRVSEFESVTLQPISYERHWRHSEAKTRVILKDVLWQKWLGLINHPAKATLERIPPLPFVLEHEISHGPLVKMPPEGWRDWRFARVYIRSKLSLTEEARKILEAEVGSSDLLNIESKMDLIDGQLTMHLEGPSFRTQEQTEKMPPAWGGVTGQWTMNSDFDDLKTKLLLPGFDFEIYDDTYQAQDIAFFADRARDDDGFWKGHWRTHIQSLMFDDVLDNVRLKLNALVLTGKVEGTAELANLSLLFRAESLSYNDEMFSPFMISVSAKRIPKFIAMMLMHLIQTKPENASFYDHVFMNDQFLRVLPRLLEARPEVMINRLFLDQKPGQVIGEMGFSIGGPDAYNFAYPQKIIKSILAQARFNMPKETLEKWLTTTMRSESPEKSESELTQAVESKINRWVQEGYLKVQEDHYGFDMHFKNGQLSVHGEQTEIPAAWFNGG